MAEQNTILQTIKRIVLSLKPLLQSASTSASDSIPPVLLEFMDELGLEIVLGNDTLSHIRIIINNLSNIYGTVAAVVETEQPPAPDKAAGMVTAITDIANTFDSFTTLNLQFTNPDGLVTTLEDFGRLFLEYLIADYLQTGFFRVYNIFILVGLIKQGDKKALQPSERINRFNFQVLGLWLSDPKQALIQLYKWGQPDFELFKVLVPLTYVLSASGVSAFFYLPGSEEADVFGTHVDEETRDSVLRVPLWVDPANRQDLSTALGIALVPARSSSGEMIGFAVVPYGAGSGSRKLDISPKWELDYRFSASVTSNYGLLIGFAGIDFKALDGNDPVSIELAASAAILRKIAEQGKIFIFGQSDLGGLEASKFGVRLGAKYTRDTPEVFIELILEDGNIAIRPGKADGFLQKMLPASGIDIPFDLTVGLSSKRGLYFEGSVGLEITIPINKTILNVITIESIYLAAEAATAEDDKPADIDLAAAITGKFALGPINASVERLGLKLSITFPPSGGNVGIANLEPTFRPPDGASLSLDAEIIKGGGYLFFDSKKHQYAGVLHLELKSGLAITAIGLITTRMPDNTPGFSLVIIITVELPPIQLGFGFTLIGLGGLLGANRSMNLNALREGVRSGMVASILFPQDPVNNASKIISDIQTIFPVSAGRFVIGPMAKIGWGTPTLISVSIGIIIEVPSPVKIAIIGRLNMQLPDPDTALIVLNLDVLGTLDFAESLLTIDAALYDSRIAMFTISGGMALRLRWGANPTFLLSVGGFNPRFQRPPDFPDVPRMAISLGDYSLGLRFESYFALTTNTLQFGARLDAWARADLSWPIGHIEGRAYFSFDALIQFSPFKLIADLEGGISIECGIIHVGGGFKATLMGPNPWTIKGYVFADLGLLGKPRIDVKVTIGEEEPDPPPPPVDVFAIVRDALGNRGNWSVQLPDGGSMLVSLRASEPAENELLVHPFGELAVRQRAVPLDVNIQRYGYTPVSGATKFTVTAVQFSAGNISQLGNVGIQTRDNFARGQFFNQTDDEKMTQPQFEALPSGLEHMRLGPNVMIVGTLVNDETGNYDSVVIDADDRIIPAISYTVSPVVIQVSVATGAASQSMMRHSGADKFAGSNQQAVSISPPVYRIVETDHKSSGSSADVSYTSYSEAHYTKQSGSQVDRHIVETGSHGA